MESACLPHTYKRPNRTEYIFGFEGVPFNFFISSGVFGGCLIFYIIFQKLIEERFITKRKFSQIYYRKIGSCCRIPYFLHLNQWEFAQRAGLDAVAYMISMKFRVYQLLALTPMFVFCCLLFYSAQETDNVFRRLTITNLKLNDTATAWKMFALIVFTVFAYFVITVLYLIEAFDWPRRLTICRSWIVDRNITVNCKFDHGKSCECAKINEIPNVIMVSGVAIDLVESTVKRLITYFDNFHPDITIRWIAPVYAVKKLMQLEENVVLDEERLHLAVREFEHSGVEPVYYRSAVCCHCTCWHTPRSRAIQVYEKRLEVYERQINQLITSYGLNGDNNNQTSSSSTSTSSFGMNVRIGNPNLPVHRDELMLNHTGVVFMGFKNSAEVIRILTQYSICPSNLYPTDYSVHLSRYCRLHKPKMFSCSYEQLKLFSALNGVSTPKLFQRLQIAPPSSDLMWTSLVDVPYRGTVWWLRLLLIRLVVLIMAIILTTPVYLLTVVNSFGLFDWLSKITRPFLFKWVPAAILAGASSLITRVIIMCENWTGHKTRGSQEYTIFNNAFTFLLFTVVLFPSLGIPGFPALFHNFITVSKKPFDRGNVTISEYLLERIPFRLECIFLTDSGVLFINYIVNCSLIGAGVRLLRLGYFAYNFLLYFCTSHSRAEERMSAEPKPDPFPFGENYAFLSIVHTVVVAYMPICPVIYCFGLIYFLIKYIMDKYMLVWLYIPNNVGPNYLRIYNLRWFLQSACVSLTGICLACINSLAFFLLRWSVSEMRNLIIANAVLTLLTLLTTITISFMVHTRVWSIHWAGPFRKDLEEDTTEAQMHDNDQGVNTNDDGADSVSKSSHRCVSCPENLSQSLSTEEEYTAPPMRSFKLNLMTRCANR